MALKLIADLPINESVDYLVEETNKSGVATMWLTGPYLMAEGWNKNKRKYQLEEMVQEVSRFKNEMINEKRALGELEHPTTANINSERACHIITELNQDGNTFIGKSKVLSSPMGMLVRSLVLDGVKLGMSSRSLGQLEPVCESGIEGNLVKGLRLVTVDVVADPSYPKAFVNGILESKQYVVNLDGTLEECYDIFSEAISSLPRKDIDKYLREQVMAFINKMHN